MRRVTLSLKFNFKYTLAFESVASVLSYKLHAAAAGKAEKKIADRIEGENSAGVWRCLFPRYNNNVCPAASITQTHTCVCSTVTGSTPLSIQRVFVELE